MTDILPAAQFLGRAPKLAEQLVNFLDVSKKRLVIAESCTGGLCSDFLVSVPGASRVFLGSFITYTVEAKVKTLGIPEDIIEKYGAVSRDTALAMAEGALKLSGADLAVSITGLAGPEGDGSGVPIGTVWMALAGLSEGPSGLIWSEAKGCIFSGERNEIREAASAAALEWVIKRLTCSPHLASS